MSDSEILSRLETLGIFVTRDSFRAQLEGRASLQELRREWGGRLKARDKAAARFLDKAVPELWRRFMPERPSVEMIDRWMQEGYEYADRGERKRAVEIWAETWRALAAHFDGETDTLDAAEERFDGLETVTDWLFDFLDTLRESTGRNPRAAELGVALCEALIAQFSKERPAVLADWRNELSGFLFAAQKAGEGMRVLEETAARYPEQVQTYLMLADTTGHLFASNPLPKDGAACARWLEKAAAVAVGPDEKQAVADRQARLGRKPGSNGSAG